MLCLLILHKEGSLSAKRTYEEIWLQYIIDKVFWKSIDDCREKRKEEAEKKIEKIFKDL